MDALKAIYYIYDHPEIVSRSQPSEACKCTFKRHNVTRSNRFFSVLGSQNLKTAFRSSLKILPSRQSTYQINEVERCTVWNLIRLLITVAHEAKQWNRWKIEGLHIIFDDLIARRNSLLLSLSGNISECPWFALSKRRTYLYIKALSVFARRWTIVWCSRSLYVDRIVIYLKTFAIIENK